MVRVLSDGFYFLVEGSASSVHRKVQTYPICLLGLSAAVVCVAEGASFPGVVIGWFDRKRSIRMRRCVFLWLD